MQYKFTERYEYVKTVEFQNSVGIQDIDKLSYFVEEDLTGIFVSKEFRYSFDNSIWSNWNTLTQLNLTNVNINNNTNFYLHVKYTRAAINTGNIQNFYLFYESSTITPPGPPIDSSIDADYLGGELPAYFLDRTNHYGSYSTLLISNISDPSGYGVYYDRIDTSLGTTFRFKSIKAGQGISITDNLGIITIDASGFSNSILNRLNSLDTSILRIDSSLNFLFNDVSTLSWGIDLVELKNDLQDISIGQLTNDVSIIDSSITDIYTKLDIRDASIEDLYSQQLIQDVSITSLKTKTTQLDISLGYAQTLNTIQDSSIISLKTKTDQLDISLGYAQTLNTIQDVSITSLNIDISILDASIIRIDTSLNYNYSLSLSNNASIGYLLNYDAIQDISIASINIDISILDASIIRIDNYQLIQDNSITSLKSKTDQLDISLGYAQTLNTIQDVSITSLNIDISILDASIIRIDSLINIIESSIAYLDNNIINIGSGDISIFSTKDNSNNILLKTIDQIGPVIITQDNSTILIDSSIVKIYDTNIDSSVKSYIQVGGISVGTLVETLDNSTYTQILNEILFPTLNPTFYEPSISFTSDISAFYEVDYNVPSINFITTFSRGAIKIQDTFQNHRSGLPKTYVYTGWPGPIDTSTQALIDNISFGPVDLSIGIHTWYVHVEYSAGPQPLNSKWINYSIPLAEGSTNQLSVSTEAVYPLFATTIDISTLTKQDLYSMINGNDIEIEFVPEIYNFKQTFDIAEYWENSRPLIGIETYNDLGNIWDWEGETQLISLTHWDVSTTTHTVQGNIINYNRYIYNGTDRSVTKIKLKF